MTPESAFDIIVVPALLEYTEAERELSRVCLAKADKTAALALVLRKSRQAAIELHQFGDRVFEEDPRPAWAPAMKSVDDLRVWVEDHHCTFMDGPLKVQDVTLIHDIADAYKHVKLRPGTRRRVLSEKATEPVSTGWGQLGWGEGKYGGIDQAIVTKLDGTQRALSSILLNVANAWLVTMGRPRDLYLISPNDRPQEDLP